MSSPRRKLQGCLEHLHEARAALLSSLDGLSQEQLNFRPAPRSWSAGEAAHHAGLAEEVQMDFVRALLQEGDPDRGASRFIPLAELPLRPVLLPLAVLQIPFVQLSLSLLSAAVPRDIQTTFLSTPVFKARTVPRMEPTRGILRSHLLRALQEIRNTTLKILAPVADWNLSLFRYRHPLIGNHDVYGVLELLASHDQRHIRQIEVVKSHHRFPSVPACA